MEIRNVQRTGNMHYVYLPTNWCKKHNINSDSKIFLETLSDGKLVLTAESKEKEKKHIELKVNEEDSEIIHKLIVASYINPLASFKITLDKEMNIGKLLDQKKLISIESVELDGKTITCESNIMVSDPKAILKTMVNKIKNLIIILKDNYNKELVERYEEEIDRSKLLIDKAVIAFFTNNQTFNQKPIELYYISILVKDLERMVDHLIQLGPKDNNFFEEVQEPINILKKLLDEPSELTHENAIDFAKSTLKIKESKQGTENSYLKERIRQLLINNSEVILDWAITGMIDD
ncbi:hypothetical protein C0585_05580 [Candidatus Woesearchaeota archaeon]|nr:MAG: hypothetical protein C0585_05580 [Candidatus Woesearchaeota archaeon]